MSGELLLCPFCGREPDSVGRPLPPGEAARFVHYIACYCGTYSADAYKSATGGTASEAESKAAEKWNTRVYSAVNSAEVIVSQQSIGLAPDAIDAQTE